MPGHKNILIAEDEAIVARNIQRRLEALGYIVGSVVATGAEAVRETARIQPDLVLMDIRLRGNMDGIEAARLINSRFNTPVVYLTAYADSDTLNRARTTEPFGYLLKPFEARELHSTIEMALHKHAMETKLRERERWLTSILEGVGEGVVVTDLTGVVTFMNPMAEILTGWGCQKACGQDITVVLSHLSERRLLDLKQALKTAREGKRVFHLDNNLEIQSRKGDQKSILVCSAPVKDEQLDVIGMVLIFNDIGRRTRPEEETARLNRLESLAYLADGIAQDFNNILTTILANISLVKHETPPHDSAHFQLSEAEEAVIQARQLTRQLLSFARAKITIKQPVMIDKLLREAATFALSGTGTKIKFDFADDLHPLIIDYNQISQVIHAIIITVRQATKEEGELEIRAENIKMNTDCLNASQSGQFIRLSITYRDEDHGLGQAAGLRDSFQATKDLGRDPGLAAAYTIINRYGGFIDVVSEKEQGIGIHIYLPRFSAVDGESGAVKAAKRSEPARVLIIDDEKPIQWVAGTALAKLGYETDAAYSGPEAIEKCEEARQTGRPYDVVIIDLTIPGEMGGRETVRRLKRFNPEIKTIASSGYSMDPILTDFRSFGFSGALAKPYKADELIRAVEQLL